MGYHPPLKSSHVTVNEPNFTYEVITKTVIEIRLPWPAELMHEYISWSSVSELERDYWFLPLTELIKQLGDVIVTETIPTDRFTDALRMVGQLEVIDRKFQREQIGNTVIVIPV